MQLLFSPILRVERPLVIGLLALLLTGCSSIDNWYDSVAYLPEEESLATYGSFLPNTPVKKEDVVIKPVTNWADWDKHIVEAREQGYIPIGSCALGQLGYVRHINYYTPWPLAVDKAVDVGADLVLIGRNETKQEEKRVVSNSDGIAWNNTFSGNTISYEQHMWLFEKRAIFFRKGNFDSFYGVFIAPPHPLHPDETEDSPVTCEIFAVLKGSQAEKDGFKAGQKVTKINGKPIKIRKDLDGISLQSISSVEVEIPSVEAEAPSTEAEAPSAEAAAPSAEAEAPSEEATPNAETETPSEEVEK